MRGLCFFVNLKFYLLCRLFCLPICEVQVFFDLPSLVAVFHRLLRLTISLAEWMFGVANCFRDGFDHVFVHGS